MISLIELEAFESGFFFQVSTHSDRSIWNDVYMLATLL